MKQANDSNSRSPLALMSKLRPSGANFR